MTPSARKLKIAVICILALVVVTLLWKADVRSTLTDALRWVAGLGPWAGLAFIGIYMAACVLFIPGSILTLGAGVVFGVVRGTIYVSIGATLGAAAAFLVGRYLARDWVSRKIKDRPVFRAIDQSVEREGWKIVGLTRLSPVFPFNLLNYAYGLTRVSFRDYFLASWIGMLPGTIMYVYVGSLAGNLANVSTGQRQRTGAEWALYILGLAATIVVTIMITRRARRALQERVSEKNLHDK